VRREGCPAVDGPETTVIDEGEGASKSKGGGRREEGGMPTKMSVNKCGEVW
jgi:hypothetical protein